MEVAALHGELGKLDRQTILTRFRNGKYRALARPPPPPLPPSLIYTARTAIFSKEQSAETYSGTQFFSGRSTRNTRNWKTAICLKSGLGYKQNSSTSISAQLCCQLSSTQVQREIMSGCTDTMCTCTQQREPAPAQIVSDVAARGLDVEGCDAVFNLELPSDAAAYAHRAGRTARMGRCALDTDVHNWSDHGECFK